MLRRLAVAATAIAAIAGLTTACSSQAATSSTGGSSASDILIGSLGAYSGAFASTEGGIPQVTAAWAATVNASGGLDGHPMRVITEDIGTTTGADLTAAKTLIGQDHVAAIFDFDTEDATWLPYAQSNGVPVIALTSAGAETSPTAFPISYAESALGAAIPSLAKTAGSKFGIVYCAEVAACGELGSIFETSAKRQGLQVPVNAKISSSAPDYTAACEDLKSVGVNSYVVIAGGAVVTEVADQCHQLGVKAVLVQDGGQAQASWKTDPAFDGLLVVDSFAPFFSDNTAAHKAYRDALTKYAPSVPNSSQDNSYSEAAWLDGQLISAAVKNIHGAITAASLKQGLYALKAETLDGMIQPVTFTPGKPTVLNCYFTWSVKNGTFVASDGDKYTCLS
jgi:branched-chain amino acid transport system substrate-binding protein